MPSQFTVFTDSNRQANVVYNSATVTVPHDQMVRFTVTGLDLVNEPDTTIIYWEIQRDAGDGQGFRHMVGGAMPGCNGVSQPHVPGHIGCSIGGVWDQEVRGSMYFVSAGDQRKKFGVSGETY